MFQDEIPDLVFGCEDVRERIGEESKGGEVGRSEGVEKGGVVNVTDVEDSGEERDEIPDLVLEV